MKFSIYTSAFNLVKNKFDYASALSNFLAFGDEVIVAVNSSEDNTSDVLRDWVFRNGRGKVRLIFTHFSYDDPFLDGSIKNAALQSCKNEYLIGVDMDERLILSQKAKWQDLATQLDFSPYQAYLIPSLDLWGSKETIRWDNSHNRKFKWYLHKQGLLRGPHKDGLSETGQNLNLDKSDGCELIFPDGKLVNACHVINDPNDISLKGWLNFLNDNVYVAHTGYLDLANRIHRNKEFWAKHWSLSAGKDIKVPIDEKELENPTFAHGLPLWEEEV